MFLNNSLPVEKVYSPACGVLQHLIGSSVLDKESIESTLAREILARRKLGERKGFGVFHFNVLFQFH